MKPYSQPPSVTFYAANGEITEKVFITKEHSLTDIRRLFQDRGM